MIINPIGYIENDFTSKFAIPRQSGLVNEIKSRIVFYDKYSSPSAFKGLEGFSHLWLIWEFDRNSHEANSLTVRPPRLGGNKRVGVFATRSPYRPNPIGLSSVKIEKICEIDGAVSIIVCGADLMNGTKIYDIKPYISYSDCHNDAINGFGDEFRDYQLNVIIPDELKTKISRKLLKSLHEILQGDPRPAYIDDKDRVFGFKFASYEIKFKVENETLTVLEIENE